MLRSIGNLFPLIFVLTLMVGCSQPLESQVSGTVTLDGKPLQRGNIVFHPAKSGTPAYGTIDQEGLYAVKSGQSAGMKPGEYIVVVKSTSQVEQSPEPGAVEVTPELLTPRQYAMKQTSPLSYAVVAGEQTIDIPLESQ